MAASKYALMDLSSQVLDKPLGKLHSSSVAFSYKNPILILQQSRPVQILHLDLGTNWVEGPNLLCTLFSVTKEARFHRVGIEGTFCPWASPCSSILPPAL